MKKKKKIKKREQKQRVFEAGETRKQSQQPMDPSDAFSASLFRWDPRAAPPATAQPCPSSISMALQAHHQPQDGPQPAAATATGADAARAAARDLEEVFEGYGVRYATVARIGDLGFTASTLVGMREEEVDDMMATLSHLFRWDLLVGERYGIKAAVRAERRRIEALIFPPAVAGSHHHSHHHAGHLLASGAGAGHHHLMADDPRRRLLLLSPEQQNALDALSQEGTDSSHAFTFFANSVESLNFDCDEG